MEKETSSILHIVDNDVNRVFEKFAIREELARMLMNANRTDAIGAAVAFLIHAAESSPGRLRTVLEATVDRPNGQRARILDVITQVTR